jgi:hypothetical protein
MSEVEFIGMLLGMLGLLIAGAWLSGHWETFWHNRMVEDLMRLDRERVPLTWEVFLQLPRRHRRFLIVSKTPSFLREELNRNSGSQRLWCRM